MSDVPNNREDTELDQKLDEISRTFTAAIDGLSNSSVLRDGIVKAAINDLIWTIYHEMPRERSSLIDALEGMDIIVRDAHHADLTAAREASPPVNPGG
jgi:hypothetical protein